MSKKSTEILKDSSDIANILPMMSVEESHGMRESIIRNGVMDPIVMHEGKILDGRNRVRIVRELNAEGKRRQVVQVDPNGGEPTITEEEYTYPTVEFTGTDQEALEFVMGRGLAGRQLSPGQKAVVAVKSILMGKRFAARAKKAGESLGKLSEEIRGLPESGDIAAWVARVGGTNRTYVYKVLKIAEAPGGGQQLDKIMSGEESINSAMDALLGLTGSEGGEGGDPGTPIVLDGLKKAVRDELVPAFLAMDDFKKADKDLKGILDAIETLCEGKGGHFLHDTALTGLLKDVRKNLRENRPYTTCPVCEGTGQDLDNHRKHCPMCKRAGYVSKLIYAAYLSSKGGQETPEDEDEQEATQEIDPALAGAEA